MIDTTDRGLTIGPIERRHYAASVTGNTDYPTWKRLMKDWYGLIPLPGVRWWSAAQCPHRLVRRRCESGYCRWVRDGGWNWPLWDHARAWRNTDGALVISLEPWGSPFDIAGSFADLEEAES